MLSILAVAMGVLLIAMGTSYLAATAESVRQAALAEHEVRARAAAEGGLTVALHRQAREAAVGATTRSTVDVGGVAVEVEVARASADRVTIRARARAGDQVQGATATIAADAVLEAAGPRLVDLRAE